MEWAIEYVMVSKRELEQLFDEDAPLLAEALYDERYRLVAPSEPPRVDSDPNMVDVDARFEFDEKAFRAHIEVKQNQQHACSEQRLNSTDSEVRLDEIVKLYAWGQRLWSCCDSQKEFDGLSEEQLVSEAIKRGYHFRLNIETRWNALHTLLTGMTVGERRWLAALLEAQPWMEKAKDNSYFPRGCVRDIDAARNAISSASQAIYQHAPWKGYSDIDGDSQASEDNDSEQDETENECHWDQDDNSDDDDWPQDETANECRWDQDENSDDDDWPQDEIADEYELDQVLISGEMLWSLLDEIAVAPDTIDRCFMQIAAMQKRFEEKGIAFFDAEANKANNMEKAAIESGKQGIARALYMSWEECRSNLAELAKSAELLASLFKAIAMAVCTNKVRHCQLDTAARIVNECKRIDRLLSVADWRSEFFMRRGEVPMGSNVVLDLLSISVTGAQNCPGTNRITKYLTIEQTRAVAELLKPLSGERLARRHDLLKVWLKLALCMHSAEADDFNQFRKFYLRAAELQCGVLVYHLPR